MLRKDVHLQMASLYELLDFIADELPRWRDRAELKKLSSETALTSKLCGHLISAARHSAGWDFLQFRVEEPDEQQKGRKIDLVASPCGTTVFVDGRRCTDFDTLLPIECKRLPTPKGKDRDEREYVINRNASTGGIQRFKAGHHGGNHTLAAMIAYVQEETAAIWHGRVASWIEELNSTGHHHGWSMKDLMFLEPESGRAGLTVYHSSHTREKGLPDIQLRHLWIEMH
ncbi:MAG: hypothetical protein Q7S51_01960 [Gallionellaceae bacterium]|nr:hypothetical protein [Gallionellaceae bacterium]